jgi:Zn-dependent peptidase ImmA (M78 family)
MKHLLKGLERYGIGHRALSENDFHRICENEGIEIIWSREKFSFYFTLMGHHFIVLPKRRRGLRLLFAMFHELGHYFMHVGNDPEAAWLDMGHHTRDEAEADAIALIALMPVKDLWKNAFFDDSRYGGHLYNERLRLYFLYGI